MRRKIITEYGDIIIKPSILPLKIIIVVNDGFDKQQTTTVLTLDTALDVIEALRASIEERKG